MNVTVLESTENPERLICQCARGDYYDGYVGDTDYAELMKTVDYDESSVNVDPREYDQLEEWETPPVVEAKTKSFIHKQLSRGHFGPAEHPSITLAIEGVSRVTMAQLTRHRHMTFDIQSMRYVDFSETDAIVPKSLVDDDHFTRETGEVELDGVTNEYVRESYEDLADECLDWYERMVEHGVPKEDARFILPLGTPVNITMSGNARTMLHVLNLREKGDAQWEIRELAEAVGAVLDDWIPYTAEWWEDNGPLPLAP